MTPWLQRLLPHPLAPLRLFCFHHAGGNAAAFRLWPRRLPHVDVCAIQLPGRGNRLSEPAMNRVPDIVDELLPSMLPLLDREYAFFGHSMGTAIAFAMAQRLQAMGERLPSRLIVSGRQPPHRPFPEPTLRGLADKDVIAEIDRRYGLPPEVLAVPEIIELMLPTLRSDFAAIEDYPPEPPQPLPLRIVAFGGSMDPCATPARLQAWQACTTRPLAMRHFRGNHFYLDDDIDAVLAAIAKELAPIAAAMTAGENRP